MSIQVNFFILDWRLEQFLISFLRPLLNQDLKASLLVQVKVIHDTIHINAFHDLIHIFCCREISGDEVLLFCLKFWT